MRNVIQGKRSLIILTDGGASRITSVEQDDDAIIITVKESMTKEERLAFALEIIKGLRKLDK